MGPVERYFGASANETLTAEELRSLSSDRAPGLDLSVTYDCSGGQYPYFCYPASYGLPRDVRVGGFRFSDYCVSTVTLNGTEYSMLRFNNLQHASVMPVNWL